MVEITNGELRVLSTQIENLTKKLDDYTNKQDLYHDEAVIFRGRIDTSIALLELTNNQICKDQENQDKEIQDLEERLNKQDTINKIFGGLGALLTLVLTFFGINR